MHVYYSCKIHLNLSSVKSLVNLKSLPHQMRNLGATIKTNFPYYDRELMERRCFGV